MENILIEFGHETELRIIEITSDLKQVVSNNTDLTLTDIRMLVYLISLHEQCDDLRSAYIHYKRFHHSAKLPVGSLDTYVANIGRLHKLGLIDKDMKLIDTIFWN